MPCHASAASPALRIFLRDPRNCAADTNSLLTPLAQFGVTKFALNVLVHRLLPHCHDAIDAATRHLVLEYISSTLSQTHYMYVPECSIHTPLHKASARLANGRRGRFEAWRVTAHGAFFIFGYTTKLFTAS